MVLRSPFLALFFCIDLSSPCAFCFTVDAMPATPRRYRPAIALIVFVFIVPIQFEARLVGGGTESWASAAGDASTIGLVNLYCQMVGRLHMHGYDEFLRM
jgi:hypothetical protein